MPHRIHAGAQRLVQGGSRCGHGASEKCRRRRREAGGRHLLGRVRWLLPGSRSTSVGGRMEPAARCPGVMDPKLVLLFDLDGTLTDPRPGIVRCMQYALDKLGAPCPSEDILASFIGPSLLGTFATLLETSDRTLVERALALYREQYGETGLFENHVYEGVAQMLDQVRRTAAGAFVATLKPKTYADRIARHLGLARYFRGADGPGL